MTKDGLKKSFERIFGSREKMFYVFSPGRVNLIGEHIDYNGGNVFPAALSIGTYFAAAPREDKIFRFYSGNFPEKGIIERALSDLSFSGEKNFTDYPMGIIRTYRELQGFFPENGMDVYIEGNLPNASGLSSSASIEVGMCVLLNSAYGYPVSALSAAKLSQFSENHYNGVNCGIMDQFAVAMGKADCAMYLNTESLQYEYVPLKLPGMKLVIACTNKKRGLSDSKYNERRAECERALQKIRAYTGVSDSRKNETFFSDISSLCRLSGRELDIIKPALDQEILFRRVRHVVTENERTVKAVDVLRKGDIQSFGRLMNASHISLRDDYEVTGAELDTLFMEATKVKGCIGSRMTGAGFGGCTVSIVSTEAVPEFIEKVGKGYREKIGYDADFYLADIADGASLI